MLTTRYEITVIPILYFIYMSVLIDSLKYNRKKQRGYVFYIFSIVVEGRNNGCCHHWIQYEEE